MIQPSELILRPGGSLYHLNLHPGQVAPTIITVGDPERVRLVSDRFDRVTERVEVREFVTHSGELNGVPLTVVSTGIGTDNVDIVMNELDALFNIDLARREVKAEHTELTFIRLGTSGAFQPDLPLGSLLMSEAALGMDGLLPFYLGHETPDPLAISLMEHLRDGGGRLPVPAVFVRPNLPPAFAASDLPRGLTLTAAGFYAPQGRRLRLVTAMNDSVMTRLRNWREGLERITNIEMETSGIYGLANLLGHRSVSLSALLANRALGTFYDEPASAVSNLLDRGLDLATNKA